VVLQPTQLLFFARLNCGLQGFENSGEESYWNMASNSVVVLCHADLDGDSTNEIILES
jgi:hypothetical protein